MYEFVKRLLDVTFSATLLLLLAPMLFGIWALVCIAIGTPAFFRQERAGLYGKSFWLYKFRSMTDERDKNGHLLPDELRLTRFGRLLRRTSMDELPQLLNVIKGEMSLVGPRPLYHFYVERYSPTQKRRMDVKPGITGLAQINGRNAISWEAKFALDVDYVDRRNLILDLTILARTFSRVLNSKNISQEGRATVDEFRGTDRR